MVDLILVKIAERLINPHRKPTFITYVQGWVVYGLPDSIAKRDDGVLLIKFKPFTVMEINNLPRCFPHYHTLAASTYHIIHKP